MKLEKLKIKALSGLTAALRLNDFDSTKASSSKFLKIENPFTLIIIDTAVVSEKSFTITIKDKYNESDAYEVSEAINASGTYLIAPLETYYYGEDGNIEIELSTDEASLSAAATKVDIYKIEI